MFPPKLSARHHVPIAGCRNGGCPMKGAEIVRGSPDQTNMCIEK